LRTCRVAIRHGRVVAGGQRSVLRSAWFAHRSRPRVGDPCEDGWVPTTSPRDYPLIRAGRPFPLGAHPESGGVRFAVASSVAQSTLGNCLSSCRFHHREAISRIPVATFFRQRCQNPVPGRRLGPLQQLTATTSCGGTTSDCGSPRCSSVQSWRHREAVP